jgi:hypothetical protein
MTVVGGTLHGFQPPSIGSPVYADGFDTHRERTYVNDEDKVGTLVVSRIVHFIAPQVGALISSEGTSPDIFVGTFQPADVNAGQDYINFAGLTNGIQVRFMRGNPNNNLPSPIIEDQFYFVVNATAGTFQIANTSGGTFIPLNNSGSGKNEIWKRPP